MATQKKSLFDRAIVRRAAVDALVKLDPRGMMKNPVMFVVEIGSVLTSASVGREHGHAHRPLSLRPANHTLAMVHGPCLRTLRRLWRRAVVRPRQMRCGRRSPRPRLTALRRAGKSREVPSSQLRLNDVVRVTAGQMIPGDGEIIDGVASVDDISHHRRISSSDPRGRR